MSALTASHAARACASVISFGSSGLGNRGSCFQRLLTAWMAPLRLSVVVCAGAVASVVAGTGRANSVTG
uniref:Uncharacterized protein n=1 Tax=Mycobacterium riyadhense TaxID=486698 RepID=A0A653EUK3_9MYCO|nr:hypothetical protein BIN_B_03494 [Mycobacterium riyadhense]